MAAAVAAAVAAATLAAGCGGGSGDAGELRLGYLANITNAAALVGKDRGIFARDLRGTVVTTTKFTTGTEATAALLSGSLDASYLGMGPVITAQSRAPGQLTVIAGAGEAGAVLVVRRGSGIRTLADLRGRRVGFPGYGNTQDLSLQWELGRIGLTAGRGQDVHTVRVANADLRTAFERGALDAALCPEPWGSALVDRGLATVLMPADRIMGDGHYPTTVLVVRTAYARAHPGVVARLREANARAVAASRDPRAVATAFLAAAKSKVPEDVLLRGIASNVPTTAINPVGTRRLIDAARDAGYLREPVTVAQVTPAR
ncbi:MAG: aliphatic sulfonate ABC transporter substrate-binding protein [Thermoleophilia bacterium]|nr:aliphatic sulfonate ABC transporter substrate-binding protein [Thermoleophilia bacterium]